MNVMSFILLGIVHENFALMATLICSERCRGLQKASLDMIDVHNRCNVYVVF